MTWWTYEQACAWCVWRDDKIVKQIAGGETVEHLLARRRRARHARFFYGTTVDQHAAQLGRITADLAESGLDADSASPEQKWEIAVAENWLRHARDPIAERQIIGSRHEFGQAIEKGLLFPNEDGLFNVAKVKALLPPDGPAPTAKVKPGVSAMRSAYCRLVNEGSINNKHTLKERHQIVCKSKEVRDLNERGVGYDTFRHEVNEADWPGKPIFG